MDSALTVDYIRTLVEKRIVLAPSTAQVLLDEIDRLTEMNKSMQQMFENAHEAWMKCMSENAWKEEPKNEPM